MGCAFLEGLDFRLFYDDVYVLVGWSNSNEYSL